MVNHLIMMLSEDLRARMRGLGPFLVVLATLALSASSSVEAREEVPALAARRRRVQSTGNDSLAYARPWGGSGQHGDEWCGGSRTSGATADGGPTSSRCIAVCVLDAAGVGGCACGESA